MSIEKVKIFLGKFFKNLLTNFRFDVIMKWGARANSS